MNTLWEYSGFMISPHLRLLSAATAVIATLLVTSCASSATTSSEASETTSPDSVTSLPLLQAVTATILDQEIIYPSSTAAQVSSSVITLPPGMETGLHKHDAPMYAYILSGELTVTYDGGTTKVYKPGEAIMEAVGTAHNGKNNGKVDVQVLVVNIGAEGVANTVKLP